jgi:cbb3-type cytochrome oxidase subunit 1
LADTRTADNTDLKGEEIEESRAAANHFLVGAGFLVLAGELQLLALMSLHFDDLFPIAYGRLEPMANFALMIGFVAISLIGGIYYVLPRLTGTRLWGNDLAGSTLIVLTAAVFVGLLTIALGSGDGRQPFGLPWWMHIPMVFLLAVPALVTVGTISNRTEERSYVTLWFVIGGVVWLPLLYLAYFSGELPYFQAIAVEYANVFFSAGFVTMFVFTVGSGLFYYTMVKELDISLASRQLALVGFWSLGFASVWWGTSQLIFGPAPQWLSGVGAALGLAFPIGALANAANASLSLEGSWDEVRERPDIRAGVVGLYLAVGVAVVAALAGFRSIAAVASLTAFWEAIEYAALAGVGTLLIASTAFAALPRLIGKDLLANRAKAFITLTVTGATGVLVFLSAAGIVSGYSWVGGSNAAAYIDAADGWAAGVGESVDTLMLIAIGFAIITFLGQLTYAATVIGTAATGKAIPQEVLVEKETADEEADDE